MFDLFVSENNWPNAPVCFGAEPNTAQSTSADVNEHTKGLNFPLTGSYTESADLLLHVKALVGDAMWSQSQLCPAVGLSSYNLL